MCIRIKLYKNLTVVKDSNNRIEKKNSVVPESKMRGARNTLDQNV